MHRDVFLTAAGQQQGQLSCLQGCLSQDAQVRGGDSSRLLSESNMSPRWQPRSGISTWPLVLTEPCCFRAMGPDVALSGSTGQDATMVPGGITEYLHHAVLHYLRMPSSASLPCARILLFLFHSSALTCSSLWGPESLSI